MNQWISESKSKYKQCEIVGDTNTLSCKMGYMLKTQTQQTNKWNNIFAILQTREPLKMQLFLVLVSIPSMKCCRRKCLTRCPIFLTLMMTKFDVKVGLSIIRRWDNESESTKHKQTQTQRFEVFLKMWETISCIKLLTTCNTNWREDFEMNKNTNTNFEASFELIPFPCHIHLS